MAAMAAKAWIAAIDIVIGATALGGTAAVALVVVWRVSLDYLRQIKEKSLLRQC